MAVPEKGEFGPLDDFDGFSGMARALLMREGVSCPVGPREVL